MVRPAHVSGDGPGLLYRPGHCDWPGYYSRDLLVGPVCWSEQLHHIWSVAFSYTLNISYSMNADDPYHHKLCMAAPDRRWQNDGSTNQSKTQMLDRESVGQWKPTTTAAYIWCNRRATVFAPRLCQCWSYESTIMHSLLRAWDQRCTFWRFHRDVFEQSRVNIQQHP